MRQPTFDLMILVTGGTGLVGAHVLFELINSGLNVRALKRDTSSIKAVEDVFSYYSPRGSELAKSIEWVNGDVEDLSSLEVCLDGCSSVFHCAAMVSFKRSDYKKLMSVNAEGTANIVNLCLDKGVKDFYYVSSVAALGRPVGTNAIDENTEWERSKENSGYAISKKLAEMEVWRGSEEGLNVAIVNPTIVLGPGRTDVSSGTLFRSINAGQRYYTLGENGYVDARDVSFVLKRLFDEKKFGSRYLLSGENLAYKEVGELMAKHLQVSPPNILAKKWMTSLAWRILWTWSKISGKPQLLTRETAKSSHRKTVYKNEKARSEIGVTFRTAEQAIINATGFFRDFPNHLN